ncbi:MAG: HlyC/CorC family transporter [Acidobacteria bacterium]|nr:HlyC/CorC family transporter [Acidobacteriota bacterium]
MVPLYIAAAATSLALLSLATFIQLMYLESLRVRPRELPALEYFKDVIEDRLGVRTEQGALAFSLWKHSLIALFGVLAVLLTFDGESKTHDLIEAAFLSWLSMVAAGYIVPQALYRRGSGRWMAAAVPFLRMMIFLIRPLTALFGFLQSVAELGEDHANEPEAVTQEEHIEALIDAGTEEGVIEEEDRRLIHSVVAFGDKTVREVMTPRPQIIAIAASRSLADLRQLVINEQFSRVPVYGDSLDDILGFIHVRDLLELEPGSQASIRDLVRDVSTVPETKPADDLLREMQSNGVHMAVVIDEYGNTAGIATMEDLVEEIVGEIRDEHEPGMDVRTDNTGGFIVAGSYDLDHLAELVGFRPDEAPESTTIGGLMTEWLGHVPARGEAVQRDGIRMEALASNDLRVESVRISRLATEQPSA